MADTIALVGYFVLTLMLLWTPASNAFIIHTSNYQRLAPRQIWSLQAEKLTSEEVRTRLEQEMQRLRAKDRTSLALKPEVRPQKKTMDDSATVDETRIDFGI